MSAIVVKQAVDAWVTEGNIDAYGLAELVGSIAEGKAKPDRLLFSDHDMTSHGWVRVGKAKLEVELAPPDCLAAEELRALNARLEAMRAEHRLAQQAILDRISKLQALPFSGEVDA